MILLVGLLCTTVHSRIHNVHGIIFLAISLNGLFTCLTSDSRKSFYLSFWMSIQKNKYCSTLIGIMSYSYNTGMASCSTVADINRETWWLTTRSQPLLPNNGFSLLWTGSENLLALSSMVSPGLPVSCGWIL